MKLSKNLKRALGCCLWLLASFMLAGCEHLYYADPNPEKPFAFPNQPAGAPMAAAPSAPTPAPVPALASANPNYVPGSIAAMPPTQLPAANGVTTAGATPLNSSILQSGDQVTISFSDIPQPGMQEVKQRIPDDGKLNLPLEVSVQAIGKTGYQLEQEIKSLYVPRYFVRLTVSVKSEERWYYVGGEVRTANRYVFSGNPSVLRAIDTAGGFGDFANRNKIELRRANGQVFMIKWKDAVDNPHKDLPVFPNDQIIVHKRIW